MIRKATYNQIRGIRLLNIFKIIINNKNTIEITIKISESNTFKATAL